MEELLREWVSAAGVSREIKPEESEIKRELSNTLVTSFNFLKLAGFTLDLVINGKEIALTIQLL